MKIKVSKFARKLLASLHVPKKQFFLVVLFERFFLFLLTPGEKSAFSQLKAFISALVYQKKKKKPQFRNM